MTVKLPTAAELIKQLEELPPDAIVVLAGTPWDLDRPEVGGAGDVQEICMDDDSAALVGYVDVADYPYRGQAYVIEGFGLESTS